MPNILSNADLNFPQFDSKTDTKEQIAKMQNYLYMLLENLRYLFNNLDGSNFNAKGLADIGATITEPLSVRIEDAEGRIAEMAINVNGLAVRVTDAEGNITTLTQTATELASRVTDAEGDISTLEQTAQGLTTRVATAEGNLSQLSQKVDGFTFTIRQNGNVITYTLGSGGATISSTSSYELWSLDGLLPPVGKVGNVIVNANGENVLEHGWYNAWGEWTDAAVYSCTTYNDGVSWGQVIAKQGRQGHDGADGQDGKDGEDGAPGQNGISLLLDPPSGLFRGNETAAIPGQQIIIYPVAFSGNTRVATTVGTLMNVPTGMTATIAMNGTTQTGVVLDIGNNMTSEGALWIPVTANGYTYSFEWRYAIARKGEKGDGSEVTFDQVNELLGRLFADAQGGKPTTLTDAYIYSKRILGGEIFGTKIYAGSGNGYTQMEGTGLNVQDNYGVKKVELGCKYSGTTSYPYLLLGAGGGSTSNGQGCVYKLGAGIWIGDSRVLFYGASACPGGQSSVVSVSDAGLTGVFINFLTNKVYTYKGGQAAELNAGSITAVFG